MGKVDGWVVVGCEGLLAHTGVQWQQASRVAREGEARKAGLILVSVRLHQFGGRWRNFFSGESGTGRMKASENMFFLW